MEKTTQLYSSPWERILNTIPQQSPKQSSSEHIQGLNPLQQKATFLANLHYQTLNGGLQQWVENGLGLSIDETIKTVCAIGTPTAIQVAEMLSKLRPFIDLSKSDRGWAGDYWIRDPALLEDDDFLDEDEDFEALQVANSLDEKYYELSDQFAKDIEAWLDTGAPDLTQSIPDQKQRPTLQPSLTGTRYPAIRVQLINEDGNAFVILSKVSSAMQRARISDSERDQFYKEATSGDYNHLLRTCTRWVTIY